MDVTGPIEEERVRPWATVLRVPTAEGTLFFKEPTPSLAHEARLIEILARPPAGARDRDRVLGRGRADADARRRPQLLDSSSTPISHAYWEESLPLYAELQIEAAADADALLQAGAFDRRSAGSAGAVPRR